MNFFNGQKQIWWQCFEWIHQECITSGSIFDKYCVIIYCVKAIFFPPYLLMCNRQSYHYVTAGTSPENLILLYQLILCISHQRFIKYLYKPTIPQIFCLFSVIKGQIIAKVCNKDFIKIWMTGVLMLLMLTLHKYLFCSKYLSLEIIKLATYNILQAKTKSHKLKAS